MSTPETGDTPDVAALAVLFDDAPAGLLTRGTFSVYKTDDGGVHIAYRLSSFDAEQGDGHVPVPAGLMRMAFGAAAGRGPLAMLRGLMG
jgi:hypothetical protein